MSRRRSWADLRGRLRRHSSDAEPASEELDTPSPAETAAVEVLETEEDPVSAPEPPVPNVLPAESAPATENVEPAAPVEHSDAAEEEASRQSPTAPAPDVTVAAPIAKPGEDRLLGHVISVSGSLVWGVFEPGSIHPVEIGAIVRLQGAFGRSFGIVTSLKRDGRRAGDDQRMVEVRMLGEVLEGSQTFQCGVSQHPALDSPIYLAERSELSLIYQQPEASTIRLGTLRQADGLPAYAVTDQLLGKHFAVLGTTGAGKSCSVTVILKSILEANPFGHIIMLDPHNEYGRAFGSSAEVLNPQTLKLPYWLLNFEEISEVLVNRESAESAYIEAAILRDAILRARKQAFGQGKDSEHITVDTPTPYRLSELVRIIKEDMGAFNRAEQVASYQHLIARIERVAADRRFAFMFSSFMVQDNMRQVLSSILRIPVDSKPVTIIDLSGMPSEIVDVVVSVLCRLVFEFVLWTDRSKAPPILLVCEEAHRYVPRDDDDAFAPTKRAISRIAKEGRKYGLSLGLVTQRPSELSVSSLSQCNTIFALRMGNEHDLNFVQHAIPEGSRWLTETMPSLNTREAVVVGAGVSVPMHIRFDELPPEHRPASTTPPFSSVWQRDQGDADLIDLTIRRWRHQMRDDPATG
ncbi:MAG: helicase HerA domain-containing protein [Geminicoccaceae bacterium]